MFIIIFFSQHKLGLYTRNYIYMIYIMSLIENPWRTLCMHTNVTDLTRLLQEN